jgi:predicted RNase H-like HicB family nuclease
MNTQQPLHLPILIEQDEDGIFIVSCPSFKACHSYGKTIEEALENIKEVIDMCLHEEQKPPLNRFVGFREIEFSSKVA